MSHVSLCKNRFKTIATAYIQPCQLVFIAYDVTRRVTFEKLGGWIREVRHRKSGRIGSPKQEGDADADGGVDQNAAEAGNKEQQENGEDRENGENRENPENDKSEHWEIILIGCKGSPSIRSFFSTVHNFCHTLCTGTQAKQKKKDPDWSTTTLTSSSLAK